MFDYSKPIFIIKQSINDAKQQNVICDFQKLSGVAIIIP